MTVGLRLNCPAPIRNPSPPPLNTKADVRRSGLPPKSSRFFQFPTFYRMNARLTAILQDGMGIGRYQNVRILDFTGAKDDEDGSDSWRYKTSKSPVKSSPPTTFFTDRMPFLLPNQQCLSTEGKCQLSVEFCENWLSSFCVIQLTNRQSN